MFFLLSHMVNPMLEHRAAGATYVHWIKGIKGVLRCRLELD